MSEVIYINTRFDPDSTPFLGLAKQMAKAIGYTTDLSVYKKLAETPSIK